MAGLRCIKGHIIISELQTSNKYYKESSAFCADDREGDFPMDMGYEAIHEGRYLRFWSFEDNRWISSPDPKRIVSRYSPYSLRIEIERVRREEKDISDTDSLHNYFLIDAEKFFSISFFNLYSKRDKNNE